MRKGFWQRNRAPIMVLLLMFCLVVVFFFPRIVVLVDAGEAGVKFRRFLGGVVLTRVYGEGVHLNFPWDTMTIYDIRIREYPFNFDVLTQNGLSVHLDVSVRFHPGYETLPTLHQRVGPHYDDKVVHPVVAAAVRNVIGKYRADELYASTDPVEKEINRAVAADLGSYFIELDSVAIESIKLPPFIEEAVEYKEQQRELLEAYQYLLRLEQQEAARKEIEAFGWSNFNTLVGKSLSQSLLQWRAIDATTELANSDNAKVVVIGNGQGGLPVILGSDYTGAPNATQAQAATPDTAAPMSNLGDRLRNLREDLGTMYRRNQPPPGLRKLPALMNPPVVPTDSASPPPAVPAELPQTP